MHLDALRGPESLENLEEGVFKAEHVDAVGLALDPECGKKDARVLVVELGAEVFLPGGRVGDQAPEPACGGEAERRAVMRCADVNHMRDIWIGFKKESFPRQLGDGGFALELFEGDFADAGVELVIAVNDLQPGEEAAHAVPDKDHALERGIFAFRVELV